MKILQSLIVVCVLVLPAQVFAHCQVPCGVFDDGRRFDMMMEHATTIEKAMNEINSLSPKGDYHTVARWTFVKEEHAEKVQDIASVYFLTQRVKANNPDYEKHLVALHDILVAAMKTRQTLDIKNVDALRDAVQAYKKIYFKEHGHDH